MLKKNKKGGLPMDTIRSESFRSVLICIDEYKDGIPIGRFYHPAQAEGMAFRGLMALLSEIESTLEQLEFPKAYQIVRTFVPILSPSRDPASGQEPVGKVATFSLRVMFRQNASWQGSVTWLEGKQMQSFRSALELVLLMNSALAA